MKLIYVSVSVGGNATIVAENKRIYEVRHYQFSEYLGNQTHYTASLANALAIDSSAVEDWRKKQEEDREEEYIAIETGHYPVWVSRRLVLRNWAERRLGIADLDHILIINDTYACTQESRTGGPVEEDQPID